MTVPMRMSDMVQMITSLGDLQERRKSRMQREQEFKTQQANLARQMGFQEGSEQWKRGLEAIKTLSEAPTEARGAIQTIIQSLGLPKELEPQLSQLVMMPESAAQFQNRTVQGGMQAMTPEQRQQASIAAATSATSGQTPLGMQLTQPMAAGQPLGGYQRAVQFNQANPVAAAVGKTQMGQPNLIEEMARIGAGGMTEGQRVGATQSAASLAQDSAYKAQTLALQILAAQQKGHTPADVINSSAELRQLREQIENKKLGINARLTAWQQYNSISQFLSGMGIPMPQVPPPR